MRTFLQKKLGVSEIMWNENELSNLNKEESEDKSGSESDSESSDKTKNEFGVNKVEVVSESKSIADSAHTKSSSHKSASIVDADVHDSKQQENDLGDRNGLLNSESKSIDDTANSKLSSSESSSIVEDVNVQDSKHRKENNLLKGLQSNNKLMIDCSKSNWSKQRVNLENENNLNFSNTEPNVINKPNSCLNQLDKRKDNDSVVKPNPQNIFQQKVGTLSNVNSHETKNTSREMKSNPEVFRNISNIVPSKEKRKNFKLLSKNQSTKTYQSLADASLEEDRNSSYISSKISPNKTIETKLHTSKNGLLIDIKGNGESEIKSYASDTNRSTFVDRNINIGTHSKVLSNNAEKVSKGNSSNLSESLASNKRLELPDTIDQSIFEISLSPWSSSPLLTAINPELVVSDDENDFIVGEPDHSLDLSIPGNIYTNKVSNREASFFDTTGDEYFDPNDLMDISRDDRIPSDKKGGEELMADVSIKVESSCRDDNFEKVCSNFSDANSDVAKKKQFHSTPGVDVKSIINVNGRFNEFKTPLEMRSDGTCISSKSKLFDEDIRNNDILNESYEDQLSKSFDDLDLNLTVACDNVNNNINFDISQDLNLNISEDLDLVTDPNSSIDLNHDLSYSDDEKSCNYAEKDTIPVNVDAHSFKRSLSKEKDDELFLDMSDPNEMSCFKSQFHVSKTDDNEKVSHHEQNTEFSILSESLVIRAETEALNQNKIFQINSDTARKLVPNEKIDARKETTACNLNSTQDFPCLSLIEDINDASPNSSLEMNTSVEQLESNVSIDELSTEDFAKVCVSINDKFLNSTPVATNFPNLDNDRSTTNFPNFNNDRSATNFPNLDNERSIMRSSFNDTANSVDMSDDMFDGSFLDKAHASILLDDTIVENQELQIIDVCVDKESINTFIKKMKAEKKISMMLLGENPDTTKKPVKPEEKTIKNATIHGCVVYCGGNRVYFLRLSDQQG